MLLLEKKKKHKTNKIKISSTVWLTFIQSELIRVKLAVCGEPPFVLEVSGRRLRLNEPCDFAVVQQCGSPRINASCWIHIRDVTHWLKKHNYTDVFPSLRSLVVALLGTKCHRGELLSPEKKGRRSVNHRIGQTFAVGGVWDGVDLIPAQARQRKSTSTWPGWMTFACTCL